LDEEKIKEIPETEITQEQVDTKLQCSVCWEDFQIKEAVRQLPCQVIS
jgi:E3 ubiquitin-protein ligase RNF115/126